MTSRLGVDKNVFLDTFPVRSVSGSGVRAPTSRTRAVSYTHLDVYKRQGQRYGMAYATPSAGNSMGMAMTHGYMAGKIMAAL